MSLDDDLRNLLEKAENRHRRFMSELTHSPDSRPCKKHPDTLGTLDRAAAQTSGKIEYWCPKCQAEERARRVAKLQKDVGVPEDVRGASFENFDYDHRPTNSLSCLPVVFLRSATEFCSGQFATLILAGTPGIGKGHLAASVINAAIHQDRMWGRDKRTAVWMTAHAFFSECHNRYGQPGGPDAYVRSLAKVDLLVMDEVGMVPLPKDGHQHLWDLYNARYLSHGMNIFLTGLDGTEFKKYLGPAIIDRLRAHGLRFHWGQWASHRHNDPIEP